jgi:hypothetical protein
MARIVVKLKIQRVELYSFENKEEFWIKRTFMSDGMAAISRIDLIER